jgi:hypothetical protein
MKYAEVYLKQIDNIRRNKMNVKKLMIVSVVMFSLVALTFAQGRGMRPNCRYYRYNQMDIVNPQTIEGEIVKVEVTQYGTGRYGEGIHLTVRSGKTETVTHLGPKAFLETNQVQFRQGDRVKITAFKGVYNDQTVFFASEVSAGGKTVMLRDNQGFPRWRASLDRPQRGYGRRGYGDRGRGRGRR